MHLLNNARRKFLVHTRRIRKIWSPCSEKGESCSDNDNVEETKENEIGNNEQIIKTDDILDHSETETALE